jgi:hypothetical protein
VTLNNGTLTVTSDDVPVIALGTAEVVYTLRDEPVLLAPSAGITDGGSADFDGGALTVTVKVADDVLPQDELSFLPDETVAGVSFSGANVLLNSVVIGTAGGGYDTGIPLSVQFNSQATPAAAEAVLRRLAFAATNGLELATRTVSLQLTDVDGGVSDIVELSANWDITHDDGGQLLEREFESYFGLGGPLQSWYELGVLSRDVYWDGTFFREDKVSWYSEWKPRGGLAFGAFVRYGSQVDFANSRLGDELRIEPWIKWNLNRHLLLKLEATKVSLDSKQDEQIFDAGVYDLRLTWQFNRRTFLRVTTQFQDIERNPAVYVDNVDARTRRLGRQLLFSYKINPQTVFFLGYSDNHFENDALNTLEKTDRTLFRKIGYAWTP